MDPDGFHVGLGALGLGEMETGGRSARFGVFWVAAGFGQAINRVEDTKWGLLLSLGNVIGTVWVHLFEGEHPASNGGVFFRLDSSAVLPVWSCWAALIALSLICLYMLHRKIRGAEVVR